MGSEESVADRLRKAYEDVLAAELPEHLQSEGLKLAFAEGVAPSDVKPPSPPGKPVRKAEPESDQESLGVSEGGFFDELSRNSEVPVEHLKEVFFYQADSQRVGLNVRGRDLGDNTKERAIALTTLLAGAHRLGLGQDLSSEDARSSAKAFKAADTNFSRYIRANPSVSYLGPTRSKRVDLKAGREDDFKELVLRLAGQSDDS